MIAPIDKGLAELLDGMAVVPDCLDRPVCGLASDSRSVQPGDVFLACAGRYAHGLAFLRQVREKGCQTVLWEPPAPAGIDTRGLTMLPVPHLSTKVGAIAARFFGDPSRTLVVCGVTGTDGKTSCVHFIAQCLSRLGEKCGVLGTLGYGLFGSQSPGLHTTPEPLTLQRLMAEMRDDGVGYVAMEVSSHAIDQSRVSGVRFGLALLTNLTRDHLDYHGDLGAYAEAKSQLFRTSGLGAAILNLDDALGRDLYGELDAVDVVAYATDRRRLPHACQRFVVAKGVEIDSQGIGVSVETSWGSGYLRSALLGRFNVSNLLAVLGCLLQLGYPLRQSLDQLSRVTTAPGRMEQFAGVGRARVIVDYAHTPHSLGQVLAALREHCEGRLICVFGCGGERDRGKRAEMGRVARRLADRIIVTDDNPRREDPDTIVSEILTGIPETSGVSVLRDRGAAIRQALHEADPADTVLVAGKGHEDYQLVGDEKRPFSDRDTVRTVLEQVA